VRPPRVATKDASLAALREIRRDRTHVALLQSSIMSTLMSTLGMRARLTPIFGCPHRSILR
jgi:hypothetical protein